MSQELCGRERLLLLLKNQPADRIGFAPLIDGYFLSGLKERKTDIQVLKEAGCEIISRHIPVYQINLAGFLPAPTRAGESSPIKMELSQEQGSLCIRYYLGKYQLRQRIIFNQYSPFIPWVVEYLIKSPDDLKAFGEIYSQLKFFPDEKIFQELERQIGDDGLASADVPTSPLQLLVNLYAGLETTVYLLADAPEVYQEYHSQVHQKNLELCRLLTESSARVFISYENTSSSTTGPRLFEKYELPCLNQYSQILKARGKIHLIHMCGKLWTMRNLLKRLTAEGFCDISPPPPGDTDPVLAKKFFPEKVIIGGIDPISLVEGNPEKLEELVKGIIFRLEAKSNGFILGSADATPKGSTPQTLKLISELVEKYSHLIG